jgi:hypothetical protein
MNWLIGGLLLAGCAYWHALARTMREDRAREARRAKIERKVREDCCEMRRWYLAKQGTTESVEHAIERVIEWRRHE